MDELLIPTRRGFLVGLIGALAAPAIVKATSLMPVKHLDRMGIQPIVFEQSGKELMALEVEIERQIRELFGVNAFPLQIAQAGPTIVRAKVPFASALDVLPGDIIRLRAAGLDHEVSANVQIAMVEFTSGEQDRASIRGYLTDEAPTRRDEQSSGQPSALASPSGLYGSSPLADAEAARLQYHGPRLSSRFRTI